jgi:hypothetical protein
MNSPLKKKFELAQILKLLILVLIPALLILYYFENKSQKSKNDSTQISVKQTNTIENLFKNSKPNSAPVIVNSSQKDCINFSFEMTRIDLNENKISLISNNIQTLKNCQKNSWFPTKLNGLLGSCLQELNSGTSQFKNCILFSSVTKLHYLSQFEIEDKSLDQLKTTELILKLLNSFVTSDINQLTELNRAFEITIELSQREDGPSDLDNLLSVVLMTGLNHTDFLKQVEYTKLMDSFLSRMSEVDRLEEVRLMQMVLKKEPVENFLTYTKNNPNSSLAHYFTAGVFWKLNDRKSTMLYLQQALNLNPSSQQIQKTLVDFQNAKPNDKIFTSNINFRFDF